MPTDTMTFSKFLRDSGAAVKSVEGGAVKLERRDGHDLLLKLAERDASEREGMHLTVGLLSVMLSKTLTETDTPNVFVEAFPWLTYLPPDDRKVFVNELFETIRASNELDRPDLIGVLVQQWKNTAEVWADPELRERLDAELDPDGEVIAKPT